MRFQPSTLSLIQQQRLFSSLAQIHSTNHLRIQQDVTNCCHRAKVASLRNLTPSCSTSRRQIRRFDASPLQQQKENVSSPTSSSSSIKFEMSGAKEKNSLPIHSREEKSKVEARLRDRWLDTVRTRNSVSPQADSIGIEASLDASTTLLDDDRSFGRWSTAKIEEILSDTSAWVNTFWVHSKGEQRRVKNMYRCIDRLNIESVAGEQGYIAANKVDILLQIGRAITEIEDHCRKLKYENYVLLRKYAGEKLQLVLNHLNLIMVSENVNDKVATFCVDCLRIQAWNFEDKDAEAKILLDILLDDKADGEWIVEEAKQVKNKMITADDRIKSYPRIHYLAEAIGSMLSVSIIRCKGPKKIYRRKKKIIEASWAELLQRPKCFLFNHFVFSNLLYRFNYLTFYLEDPTKLLDIALQQLDTHDMATFTSSLCYSLLRDDGHVATYNIYRWAQKKGVTLDEAVIRNLIRYLVKEKSSVTNLIEEVMKPKTIAAGDSIKKNRLELTTYRGIAWASAKRVDEKMMEEALERLSTEYPNQDIERMKEFEYEARCLCYTRAGDVDRVTELIEGRYDVSIAPEKEPQDGLLYPDYLMHQRLVQTYLRANQIEQAEATLYRMVHFGFRPGIVLMNSVLDYYAKIGDISSTSSLFQQMHSARVKPDTATYTILITLFAKRKDVESASMVLKTMREAKREPDRQTYNSLLNAHVEAYNWNGATEIFLWMLNHPQFRFQPSSYTYNIMLKAHVLRGLPIQEVFDFFKQMINAGFEPDERGFTLVLQSVTDAGFMDLAETVFTNIEERLGGKGSKEKKKGANLYHFTIMVQGYIRLGQLDIARRYVNELRQRGFAADGILWSILVRAYAARDDGLRLDSTRDMVRGVEFDQQREYASIYQPLIQAYSKRANVDQVETLLEELTDRGSEVSLHLWTSLLDAFRRQDNADGALDLWNMIFDKAIETLKASKSMSIAASSLSKNISTAEEESPFSSVTQGRRDILCVPLSILIDALTKQNRFEEVAQEWLRCRKAGFAFDSVNWNHLCVSFIKAGRLGDSFNILQRVLNALPPSREWRNREVETDVDRKGALNWLPEDIKITNETSERFGNEKEEMTESPSRPPNRRHEVRIRDDFDARYPLVDEVQEEEEEGGGGEPKNQKEAYGDGRFEEEKSVDLNRYDANLLLVKHLKTQSQIDKEQSNWYAHFETMLLVRDVIREARRSGGTFQLKESEKVNIEELLQQYPRVGELLELFEEKIENIEEKARLDAIDANRRQ